MPTLLQRSSPRSIDLQQRGVPIRSPMVPPPPPRSNFLQWLSLGPGGQSSGACNPPRVRIHWWSDWKSCRGEPHSSSLQSSCALILTLPQDIYRERFGINFDQWFTNQREVSVLKSDVWRSIDGVNWELVTPGCRAPQLSLVAKGNTAEKGAGTLEARCETEADCYGPAESCQLVDGNYTCVCQMWGPREQHTVSVFGGYMYVIGGYGSALFSQMSNCGAYACGDTNAGSYRYYHNVSPLPPSSSMTSPPPSGYLEKSGWRDLGARESREQRHFHTGPRRSPNGGLAQQSRQHQGHVLSLRWDDRDAAH
jgi:hypothetical protein